MTGLFNDGQAAILANKNTYLREAQRKLGLAYVVRRAADMDEARDIAEHLGLDDLLPPAAR